MGLPGTVILPYSWEKNYSNPKSMPLIHEFGHFWGAPITVPLTVLAGITIAVGFAFDIVLEATGIKEVIKESINNSIGNLE